MAEEKAAPTDVCQCTARRFGRCPHCHTYQHKPHPRCDNQHHEFDPIYRAVFP